MAIMASDKRLYTELLLLYKDFPCLWDTRQIEYANREAKNHAYDILLEKYREIEVNANLVDLKKKIEYMRATYRREHKKVLLAQVKGGEEYIPKLWYYDLLTFLNEVGDFSRLEPVPRGSRKKSRDRDSNYSRGSLDEESRSRSSEKPRVKKRKRTSPPAVYLDENNSSMSEDGEDHMTSDEFEIPFKQESNQSTFVSTSAPSNTTGCEWEAFGTTVGLQLKDLDPTQRMIAEKLISDIIFDARFNKLTINSAITHD